MQKSSSTQKTIAVVLGTRPEAVKLIPLINELRQQAFYKVLVVSTGQHREMLQSVFDFFKIRPDIDLDIISNGTTLVDVCTSVFKGLEKHLKGQPLDGIFVQGDTATCFSAATWGFLNRVPVFHLEAGLRTRNMNSPWPEEFNRKATSLAASLHFAPTDPAAMNLIEEGISAESIFVVGNTVIDALLKTSKQLENNPSFVNQVASELSFLDSTKKLILATVHRRESFGKELENIFTALKILSERSDVQIVIPLHLNPSVQETARNILGKHPKVFLLEPQSYLSFVYLMKKAVMILTDSGSVQEEAPSLGKPVLVLRNNTERKESITAGTCKLVGTQTLDIIREVELLLYDEVELEKYRHLKNPYGNGDSSKKIVTILNRYFGFESVAASNETTATSL